MVPSHTRRRGTLGGSGLRAYGCLCPDQSKAEGPGNQPESRFVHRWLPPPLGPPVTTPAYEGCGTRFESPILPPSDAAETHSRSTVYCRKMPIGTHIGPRVGVEMYIAGSDHATPCHHPRASCTRSSTPNPAAMLRPPPPVSAPPPRQTDPPSIDPSHRGCDDSPRRAHAPSSPVSQDRPPQRQHHHHDRWAPET